MLKLITIKHLIATGASIVLFSWLELETSGRGLVFFARNPLSNLLQPPQSEEQLEQVQENVTTVLGHHMKSIEHLELQPWQKETIQRVHDMGPHETYHSMDYSSVCVPPASHISSYFCCGGQAKKVFKPESTKGHTNNPHSCHDKTEQDHEQVHAIALQNMVPLSPRAANKCDVCQIADTLYKHNLTMAFLGDSVTHQMAYGWLCALQTRNYQVTTTMLPKDATSFEMHISSPAWQNDTAVVVTFYNFLVFYKKLETWDDLLASTDVLVANFGAHWAQNATRHRKLPQAYRHELDRMLQYWTLKPHLLPKLVAFRETSAQHFHADAGEFFLWDQQPNKSRTCQPHPKQSQHYAWREKIATASAQKNGFRVLTANASLTQEPKSSRELVWLPFLDFTSRLDFFHPTLSPTKPLDCTHFCQSPYLWWPVWRSLRLAVDRAFS